MTPSAPSTEPLISPQRLQEGPGARLVPDPAYYLVDDALRRAVNVAYTLGMPLLVTGEPGTGKTQLAYRLAWDLNHAQPPLLRFDTKSNSVACDLFYQFDSVRHYARSQLAAITPGAAMPQPRDALTLRALGLAILRTRPWADIAPLVSDHQARSEQLVDASPRRSVVLIDEIDKAPRDFPNDLLNQIEDYRFDIPELGAYGLEASTDRRLWPIVVITSNSERQLPEAFLRRCVYHHITLPRDSAQRDAWVDGLLRGNPAFEPLAAQLERSPALQGAVNAYWALRDRANLAKHPSTSELLAWLRALVDPDAGVDLNRPLDATSAGVRGALGALLKTSDDLAIGSDLLMRLRSSPAR